MIEIGITKTSKVNPRDKYSIYSHDIKTFKDMIEAIEWIKEEYPKSKRASMYIDGENGEPIKCGYVIGFRNRDYQDGKWTNFLEAHWLTFYQKEVMKL